MAGLTQAALAERAGTSQSALARYETGAVVPALPTLERILAACGRTLVIEATPADSGGSGEPPGVNDDPAGFLRRHNRRLLDAAARHGVSELRVFGSASRGDAGPESDVDLLVELTPGRTLLDLAAFRDEAAAILGLPVDVVTEDILKRHVRESVIGEAVPIEP